MYLQRGIYKVVIVLIFNRKGYPVFRSISQKHPAAGMRLLSLQGCIYGVFWMQGILFLCTH